MCQLKKWLFTWKAWIPPNRHYSLAGVIGSETQDHLLNYDLICEWIRTTFNTQVVANKEVRQFKDLKPLFSSVSILPDVVIYTENWEVPLLLFEVHSSPYDQTLKKMALILMEHLRWLRNHDSSIVEWSGFCFPKHVAATFVLRVDISWDCQLFEFIINLFPLQSNDFEDDIRRTLHKRLEMVQKDTFKVPSGPLIGLPLGAEGLGVFWDGACQLPSNNLLIENTLYKYNVDATGRSEMLDLLQLGEQSQCQLPIDVKTFDFKSFLVFPMRIFPLLREEAIQCLPKFVESVAEALHSLHREPLRLAHLDVRLENICFRTLGTAYAG